MSESERVQDTMLLALNMEEGATRDADVQKLGKARMDSLPKLADLQTS